VTENVPYTMKDAAAGLHETYLSLVAAGFTKWQALQLVGNMLRPQPQDPAL